MRRRNAWVPQPPADVIAFGMTSTSFLASATQCKGGGGGGRRRSAAISTLPRFLRSVDSYDSSDYFLKLDGRLQNEFQNFPPECISLFPTCESHKSCWFPSVSSTCPKFADMREIEIESTNIYSNQSISYRRSTDHQIVRPKSRMSDSRELEGTASFVRDGAFSPVIAVLTSFDVDVLCEKNNLSFCELLLPFTQLANENVIKDPNNQNLLIKNLKLDFRDLRRDGFLSNSALSLALGEMIGRGGGGVDGGEDMGDGGESGESGTPWYDSYRRQFLRLLDPIDHEFNRHYLACILVVSTMHDDPLDQLNRLNQAQHALQHQQQQQASSNLNFQLPKHAATPKWFSPNTFKYHLVLHDVANGDDKKAESVYQGMKMNYGAHACHLLRINSAAAPQSTPDPWAGHLRNRLRNFNNLRIQDDGGDDSMISENNNGNESGGNTSVNGETAVFVAEDQVDGSDGSNPEGSSIPHPLSSTDLPGLEKQANSAPMEREERTQAIYHGQWLTPSDIDRVKIFIQEFSVRGLFPYVERQLRLLNEQVNARRGFQKTVKDIFTTKLWGKTGVVGGGGSTPNLQGMAATGSSSSTFGYSSSSSSALPSPEKGSAAASFAPSITYAYESAEMQARRLADLAALFQIYELAFGLYNSLKKEFHGSQAWLHSASAAEFATLCIFLSGPTQSRPYRPHYMEEAIIAYLGAGATLLASRATIFSTAVLCASNDHGQSASQYIRMSSGDDLRSALFLEQAASCFIRAGLRRKAALHLILAGHRYGKAGKRQHTARCYQNALKTYDSKGWRHALDHIYLTLGLEVPPSEFERRTPARARGNLTSEPFIPRTVKTSYDSVNAVPHSLGAGETVVDQRSPVSDSIQCAMLCQPMIEHDFSSFGLCRVTVALDIAYTDEVEELTIKSYAGGMSPPNEFQQFYRGYPPLLWSSSCRRIQLTSSHDQSTLRDGLYRRRVDLTGLVTIPGIYDISSIRISCRRRGSQWEDLPLAQSQYLTVIEKSSRTDYGQARSQPETSIYYSMS